MGKEEQGDGRLGKKYMGMGKWERGTSGTEIREKRDKWNRDMGKEKGTRRTEIWEKETRGRKTWEKRNMGMGDMVNKKRG